MNREPYELDAAMFEDELPAFANARTARVAAGLGSIARVVAEGQEIYRGKLTFDDARRRIEQVHRPYHRALKALLDEAKARFGMAILIDWHSMPSAAAGSGRLPSPDLVLGDRFGAACSRLVTNAWERELEGARLSRGAQRPPMPEATPPNSTASRTRAFTPCRWRSTVASIWTRRAWSHTPGSVRCRTICAAPSPTWPPPTGAA